MSHIVKGIKKWELRKRRTNVRGEVMILSEGKVVGKAELVDVKGPFSVEELKRFKHLHRVNEKELEKYSEGRGGCMHGFLKAPRSLITSTR